MSTSNETSTLASTASTIINRQANLVHKAFDVIHFVERLPLSIECMTCYDNMFILGTNTGRILVYEIKISQMAPIKPEPSFEKSITVTKKPITQLEAIKSFNTLIALFDSQLHIFDLETFQLRDSITKTKGCSLFSVSISNDNKLLRLCVACKKKLQFFYSNLTNKTKFMELVSDLELSDIPRTLEFTKDNLIVFSLRKEYFYYELPSTSAGVSTSNIIRQPQHKFNTGQLRNNEQICQKLYNDYFVVGIDDNSTVLYDSKGKPYLEYPIVWSSYPSMVCAVGSYLIAILPSSNSIEVMTIEPQSTSVQLLELNRGESSSSTNISSSMNTPNSAISSSLQIASSFTSRMIEASRLGVSPATNQADKLKILKSNGNSICYVGSQSNLWCLIPYKINEQIEECIQYKNYELGITLISSQIDFNKKLDKNPYWLRPYPNNTDSLLKPFFSLAHMKNDVNEILERRIKNLNALDYFCRKKFTESFKLFQELKTDPSHIISFIPGLLPDKYRSRLNLDEYYPTLNAKEQEDAINSLIDYLQNKRNEILRENKDPKQLNDSSNFNLIPLIEGRIVLKTKLQLLQVIDTTLLKCYLKSKENLVQFFLKRDQLFVDLGESERLLKQHNKLSELIILYQKNEEHDSALKLLSNESTKSNSNLSGLKHMVDYIKKLNNKHLDLIFKYSKSIIETEPSDWGMKILIGGDPFKCDEILKQKANERDTTRLKNRRGHRADNYSKVKSDSTNALLGLVLKMDSKNIGSPNDKKIQRFTGCLAIKQEYNSLNEDEDDEDSSKDLNKQLVLEFLVNKIEPKELSMNLVRFYLQYCIYIWGDETTKINNHLIDIYKEFIENPNKYLYEMKNTSQNSTKRLSTSQTYKQLLIYFLSESNSYEPTHALSKLDLENYAEERAIVLGKMGKHNEALNIYVNLLNDTDKAETYCEMVYAKNDANNVNKNVYYELLQIYLNSDYEEIRIDASIRLLNAHSDKIGTTRTLELLPAQLMKCKNLSQFFENMLNRLVRNKHDTQVKNQLMIALQLQVHETKINCQDKKIIVTDDQICKACNKRMGRSAMVRYPNGTLIHYGCYSAQNN